MSWYDVKTFIEHASGFSMDALHVIVGVILQLLLAQLFARRLGSWVPWLAVLAVEIANEAGDLWAERWPDAWMQFGEGAKDIVLTMLIPTALFVAARWAPRLLVGTAPTAPASSLAEADQASSKTS